jgi:UDP-N-acetylmuramyl pentapeptide phosphotransferase/UDP-N-acetylglucosamine-1-phosphate transferase
MPSDAVVFAVSAANRWLAVFSVVALVVLGVGAFARQAARRAGDGAGNRSIRRRAGALVAIGPLVGLALAPSPDTLTVVAGLGAGVLAAIGLWIERSPRADRLTMTVSVIAAGVAAAAGAEFGPTGVPVFDVGFGFLFVLVVTQAADGLGNVDGLAPGLGAASAAGLFALAGFGGQDDLATVALGLFAACFSFLAFNLRPASLYVGRGGRLAIGYALAVGVLAVDVRPGAPRALLVPLLLVGVLLIDAAAVVLDRLRRRRSLVTHRTDHLVHRLAVLGWSPGEAVVLLVLAQVVLAGVGVFVGRAVLPTWVGLAVGLVVTIVLATEAARGSVDRDKAPGPSRWFKVAIGVLIVLLVAAIAPVALVANDAKNLMEAGREAASRGLAAARDGDTITASASFHEAALTFEQARDKLESTATAGSVAVPFLAPNVEAARALAEIGTDLGNAGESVTVAVDPQELQVIDGRLPLDVVERVTPVLREGADTLSAARRRLDDIRDDPYLASPVRDAVEKVHTQLARADREAQHAAAAAELAPALFGGRGTRHYLLVVQNNAEARATGGFIGNYGIITAENGKLDVGELQRTASWNNALRDLPDPSYTAPDDYRARYGQFLPTTTLQNVNFSPDFPSVGQVLMSLAPQAGVGPVDGVLAVDPYGLAALLQLTGPIRVEGWPTQITAQNVVDVTLRDAYAAFERSPERADFLGDVAQVAVDTATDGDLGKPASIAKVLGGAAHAGHLVLAFSRPEEQALAVELDVAGGLAPPRGDALAVTTSNIGANKLDYYLQRTIDYEVRIDPGTRARSATVDATLEITLENTAPDSGLPEAVIGPFSPNYVAGENRSFLSLYSPLTIDSIAVNDRQLTTFAPTKERDRNVYSRIDEIAAKSSDTIGATLSGTVDLHDGWYDVVVRYQPTVNPDRVQLSVDVPEGWRIDKARGMERPFSRRASVSVALDRTRTYGVHVVRDPGTWDLWARLEAGV